MRGARLEDCRDVDTGYQSKLSHRARSERGDERKPASPIRSMGTSLGWLAGV